MGSREAHGQLQNRLFMELDAFEHLGQKWFQPVFNEYAFRNCWRADWKRAVDVAAFRTLHDPTLPVVNEAYVFEVKSSDDPAARRYGIGQLITAAEHFMNKLDYTRFFGYLVTPSAFEEIVAIRTDEHRNSPQINDAVRPKVIDGLIAKVRMPERTSIVYDR